MPVCASANINFAEERWGDVDILTLGVPYYTMDFPPIVCVELLIQFGQGPLLSVVLNITECERA